MNDTVKYILYSLDLEHKICNELIYTIIKLIKKMLPSAFYIMDTAFSSWNLKLVIYLQRDSNNGILQCDSIGCNHFDRFIFEWNLLNLGGKVKLTLRICCFVSTLVKLKISGALMSFVWSITMRSPCIYVDNFLWVGTISKENICF